jgi:hypothetical protein
VTSNLTRNHRNPNCEKCHASPSQNLVARLKDVSQKATRQDTRESEPRGRWVHGDAGSGRFGR